MLDGPGEAFEPDLAVSPSDPDHWIVAQTPFQGLRSLRAHITTDAGATWKVRDPTEATVEPTDLRLEGCQEWIDAGAVIAKDGTAWVVAIGWGQPDAGFLYGFSGPVVAFESPDGGESWTQAHVLSPADPLRSPCRDAATTGDLMFHSPDMSRVIIDSGGAPLVTWAHREAHPTPGSSFGIGTARWDSGWSTEIRQITGECTAMSGPQPFLDVDGERLLATLEYDSDGVVAACILREGADSWEGERLGEATLAWPRGAVCGGSTWVVHQNAGKLIVSRFDNQWETAANLNVGEGAATPSIGCLGGRPVVTTFVPDQEFDYHAWWLHTNGTPQHRLGGSSGQTMDTGAMGHYMDIEAAGTTAVAVWVSDASGSRQVHVASLTGLLDRP